LLRVRRGILASRILRAAVIPARRIAASLLVATVLLATALPCPPAEAETADGHPTLSGNTGGAERPLEFGRACPCSCDTKGGAPAGAQPGFGLARAEEPQTRPDARPLIETATSSVREPSSGEDRIPI